MENLTSSLEELRRSVDDFLAEARAVPAARWPEPRAPGKWSPGQVAEHVTLALEQNAELLRGPVAGGVPRMLRPVLRLAFNWILRKGRFMKGSRAPGTMVPAAVPAAAPVVLGRLEAAAAALDADAAAHGATVDHPFFGRLSLVDFVRFQALHTRHHQAQLAPAAGAA